MRRRLAWAILGGVAVMMLMGLTLLAIQWRGTMAEMDAARAIRRHGFCSLEDGVDVSKASFLQRWRGSRVKEVVLLEKATREDLDRVSTFRDLRRLDLGDVAGVHDGDLAWISKLEHLRYLNLTGAAITDEGLAQLYGTRIEELDISSTNVTEEGILRLAASCPQLQTLIIRFCRITPAGVMRLPTPSLRLLMLDIDRGHQMNVREFMQRHPACQLYW